MSSGRDLSHFAVAQLGARRHYAIPRMLHSAGRLDRLYVDATGVKGPARALRLVPPGLRSARMQRLLDRVPVDVPLRHITAFHRFGLEYVRRLARAANPAERLRTSLWSGETFCRLVIEHMGARVPGGTYTFQTGGLELLRHVREAGGRGILDQTIAPHAVAQRLLGEERERHPGWEDGADLGEAGRRLAEREHDEWESASLILCGSEFVRRGVVECGGPADRCAVVPLGADPRFATAMSPRPHGGPLRVLTVGSVGLRKGLPYVLRAAELLGGAAQFRVVGPIGVGAEARRRLEAAVDLVGPVPRSAILAHYAWADVFLLPSLCEGSAGVTYEALAAGLPVVTTEHSGSVVRDAIEGFMVPIRDAEAIADRLKRLADSAELVRELSENAQQRIAEYTLERYKERLVARLAQHLAEA